MMNKLIGVIFILLTFFSCKTQNADQTKTNPKKPMCAPKGVDALADTDKPAPVFENLGALDFEITTKSKEARKYFLQGIKLANGFNHMEAARSLLWATKVDPECAMCHWGLAYVLGPNYNAGMSPEVVELAYASVKTAKNFLNKVSPKEKLLIKAMSKRYPPKVIEDRSAYDKAYMEGLRVAHKAYPNDDNIAALLAEAIMDIHPWDLWKKNGEPQPWTPEILGLLESVLERNPRHIATIHLYIHATEASQNPNRALKYARHLPNLAPGAGHLVHMPSHTYIRTGHYHEGTVVNQKAVTVDSTYVSACHAAGAYPLAYYPHNIHFIAACAALEGRAETAIEASYRIASRIDTSLMMTPGLGALQHYWIIPYYTLVKFAKWDEILSLSQPGDAYSYPMAIYHYAQGMAYVNKNEMAKAVTELQKIETIEATGAANDVMIWDINAANALIKIAIRVLGGEIAKANQHYTKAEQLLREAIELEDGLNYQEPPDWFFSVRHQLGALLLQIGKYAEAEAVYRKDLELFPETGWALNGLLQSLVKQNKMKAAADIERRFENAWQYADVELDGSIVKI